MSASVPVQPWPIEAEQVVEEIIRTGLLLAGVAEDFVASVDEDAFPGEDVADVIVEMLGGTIAPALAAAGPEAVRGSLALLGAVRDRTLADLEAACERARRHGPRDGRRRRRRRGR